MKRSLWGWLQFVVGMGLVASGIFALVHRHVVAGLILAVFSTGWLGGWYRDGREQSDQSRLRGMQRFHLYLAGWGVATAACFVMGVLLILGIGQVERGAGAIYGLLAVGGSCFGVRLTWRLWRVRDRFVEPGDLAVTPPESLDR
jgi:hypothetical protein